MVRSLCALLFGMSLALPAIAQPGRSIPKRNERPTDQATIDAQKEALTAARREHGADDVKTAQAARRLGETLSLAGRWEEALEADLEALRILLGRPETKQRHLGATHAEIGVILTNLGRMAKALEHAEHALTAFALEFGEDSVRSVPVLYLIAGIQTSAGRHDLALRALERARQILLNQKELDLWNYYKIQIGTSEVLINLDNFDEARRNLEDLETRVRDHPEIRAMAAGRILGMLGSIERMLGRQSDARQLFEKWLAAAEVDPSFRPSELLVIKSAIANCVTNLGDYKDARRRYEEIMSSPHFGDTPAGTRVEVYVNGAAAVANREGRHGDARALALKALEVVEGLELPSPVRLAMIRNCLSAAEIGLGNFEAALVHAEIANRHVREHGLVDLSFLPAASIRLAQAQWALGRKDDALETLASSVGEMRHYYLTSTSRLSESERLSALARARFAVDTFLTAAMELDVGDPRVPPLLLNWKGLVLRAMQAERSAQRKSEDEGLRDLEMRLAKVIDDLQPFQIIGRNLTRNAVPVREILSERDRLEREINRRIETTPAPPEVEIERICQALGADEALIDFMVWENLDLKVSSSARREPRLLAVVLRKDEAPRTYNLGKLAPIEEALRAHLKIVERRTSPAAEGKDLADSVASALRQRVLDPLEPALKDVRRFYIVPDGTLAFLAFETLPGKAKDSYLIEEQDCVYLTSAADLCTLVRSPESSGACLVGGVDFGTMPESGRDSELTRSFGLPLSKLPESTREIDAIAALLSKSGHDPKPKISRLVGGEANEEAVRASVKGKRFVHFATHGLFARQLLQKRAHGPDEMLDRDALLPYSGILSGIALAGINQGSATGVNDGFLSAAEVAWLDLGDCDLVTLSSCDSGRGVPRNGESVLGLRRSLRLAGARTSITALWRVDDAAASALMQRFYRELLENGSGKADAFRTARRAQIEENRKNHQGDALPGTWGAFVLEGAWN